MNCLGFGEEVHRGKLPLFAHRTQGVYSHLTAEALTAVDFDFGHLAELVFITFQCQGVVSPHPPFHTMFCGRRSLSVAYTQEYIQEKLCVFVF